MLFQELFIAGAYLIEPERKIDERGYFARTWCAESFARVCGVPSPVQANMSYNKRKGTIRGLHFQRASNAEVKIVSCTSGAVFDVLVDLRRDSPTFGRHFATKLNAENGRQLLIPEGCAHGYQTLTDRAEVSYLVTSEYAPNAESGVRWDDPDLNIRWPRPVNAISTKDANLPRLTELFELTRVSS